MVESRLHKQIKKAVAAEFRGNNYCRTEYTEGHPWDGMIRVDVLIVTDPRRIHYEVELKPNIRNLRLKAAKRRRMGFRTGYNLVVTRAEYGKHDWGLLSGSFDKVYCFDTEAMQIVDFVDTRILGGLQDVLYDSFIAKAWSDSYFHRLRFGMWYGSFVNRAKWCSECIQGLRYFHTCWRDNFCPLDNLLKKR